MKTLFNSAILGAFLFLCALPAFSTENNSVEFNAYLVAMKAVKNFDYKVETFSETSMQPAQREKYQGKFKKVVSDTTLGYYYYIQNSDASEILVYSGKELIRYSLKSYGKDLANLIIKEKYPSKFASQDNPDQLARNLTNSNSGYCTSPLAILTRVGDLSNYSISLLSDSTINGYNCQNFMLVGSGEKNSNISVQIFFDKKSKMPVQYSYFQPAFHEIRNYSDYSFKAPKNSDFTRKAFPKNCKFSEEASKIREKQSLVINQKAPDFEIVSINGEKHNLTGYKGEPLILEFSAVSCSPCLIAAEDLVKIHEQNPNLKIASIYKDGTNSGLRNYAEINNIKYDLFSNSKKVVRDYKVSQNPTFFLIDKDGVIVYIAKGWNKAIKAKFLLELEKIKS